MSKGEQDGEVMSVILTRACMPLGSRRNPGNVTIPKHRFTKTMQHTRKFCFEDVSESVFARV